MRRIEVASVALALGVLSPSWADDTPRPRVMQRPSAPSVAPEHARMALVGVEVSATDARIAFAALKSEKYSPERPYFATRWIAVIDEQGRPIGRVPVPEPLLCRCTASEDHWEGDVLMSHRRVVMVSIPWVTGREEVRLITGETETVASTVRLQEFAVAPR